MATETETETETGLKQAAKLTRRTDPKTEFALETTLKVIEVMTPQRIADALERALGAKIMTKEGLVDDCKTQLRAVEIALETTLGKPVSRQEIVYRDIKTEEEVMSALLRSPAARDALRRQLDEAEMVKNPVVER